MVRFLLHIGAVAEPSSSRFLFGHLAKSLAVAWRSFSAPWGIGLSRSLFSLRIVDLGQIRGRLGRLLIRLWIVDLVWVIRFGLLACDDCRSFFFLWENGVLDEEKHIFVGGSHL